jgi:hypothetical protein
MLWLIACMAFALGGAVVEAEIAPWLKDRVFHEIKAFAGHDVPAAPSPSEREDPRWQRAAMLSMVAARHGVSILPQEFVAASASASADSAQEFVQKVAGRYGTSDGRLFDLSFSPRTMAGEDWEALCSALDEGKPFLVLSAKDVAIGYKTAWWWSSNDTRSPADASPTVYWIYTYQPFTAHRESIAIFQFEHKLKPKQTIDAIWEAVFKPATD